MSNPSLKAKVRTYFYHRLQPRYFSPPSSLLLTPQTTALQVEGLDSSEHGHEEHEEPIQYAPQRGLGDPQQTCGASSISTSCGAFITSLTCHINSIAPVAELISLVQLLRTCSHIAQVAEPSPSVTPN
jgi:hypothetical protein